MKPPLFAADQRINVILPTELEEATREEREAIEQIPLLLEANRKGLTRELGAEFDLVKKDPGRGSRWFIGPGRYNPPLRKLSLPSSEHPYLFLDPQRSLLITDAEDFSGVIETFSLLRSLPYLPDGLTEITDCQNIDEVINRVVTEVGNSYPAFEHRGLSWEQLCSQHIPLVRSSSASAVPALQRWLAGLQDAHTWVRPAHPQGYLPWTLRVEGSEALFLHLPESSRAWEAGVRPGFRLLDTGIEEWKERTAATPHQHPFLSGRRLLSGEIGEERTFTGVSTSGKKITWQEKIPDPEKAPVCTWRRLPGGTGYIRITVWRNEEKIGEIIDEAMKDAARAGRLVVDLRGNGGGNIMIAHSIQSRFVHREELMGSIRYSLSHRVLSEPEPIIAQPAPEQKRWHGKVRFLTDPLTYSSSEDMLLGLQGLDHVEVMGEQSGGGSGRVRSLRLLPGYRLTVSTALTYDRRGHPIEGNGIPLDRFVPQQPEIEDILLYKANQGW